MILDNFAAEEIVEISLLKPHPRNYVEHPDDQLQHIMERIKKYGIYRNILIAEDNVILAGHGVVEAAKKLGFTVIPVRRLAISSDSDSALDVLVGDNEVRHLAEIDDRALSEILKNIFDSEETDLLGTGFDEIMLANLVYITRPESEIENFDAAAEWVGMPEYEKGEEPIKIIVSFRDENDRAEFCRLLELDLTEKQKSTWWPPKVKEDLASLRFVG